MSSGQPPERGSGSKRLLDSDNEQAASSSSVSLPKKRKLPLTTHQDDIPGDIPISSSSESETQPIATTSTGLFSPRMLMPPPSRPQIDFTEEQKQAIDEWCATSINFYHTLVPHRTEKYLVELQEFMESRDLALPKSALLHYIRKKHDENYDRFSDPSDSETSPWKLSHMSDDKRASLLQQQVYQLKMDMKQRQLAWDEKLKYVVEELFNRLSAISDKNELDCKKSLESFCQEMKVKWRDMLH